MRRAYFGSGVMVREEEAARHMRLLSFILTASNADEARSAAIKYCHEECPAADGWAAGSVFVYEFSPANVAKVADAYGLVNPAT